MVYTIDIYGHITGCIGIVYGYIDYFPSLGCDIVHFNAYGCICLGYQEECICSCLIVVFIAVIYHFNRICSGIQVVEVFVSSSVKFRKAVYCSPQYYDCSVVFLENDVLFCAVHLDGHVSACVDINDYVFNASIGNVLDNYSD